jgi:hypothetical protein
MCASHASGPGRDLGWARMIRKSTVGTGFPNKIMPE